MGFLTTLFDTSGFPARWRCGSGWQSTPWLGWLHIVSDLGVWSAYVAIPCVLIYFVVRKKDIPFRIIFLLFGAFILACGTTHLMEAIIFWWPAYYLAGFIKLMTAIVSWATVFALIPVMPRVLAMRSPEELEREIAARRQVEAALSQTNAQLEHRVDERTHELKEAERSWRSLAEAVPNLVWTDRPDGFCDYLSSQWGSYTGVPPHELLGFEWLERVVHPDDRERTRDCWKEAVEVTGVYDVEFRIRRHDGIYHWFQARGVPHRDDHGKILKWFGTCTDIEDHKQAEAALRDADRRKDEFLATLAHELRNPLAPVRNALQILKMPGVDSETTARMITMMEHQADHLVRLVDDLMDVSRIMRGRIQLQIVRVEMASVIDRAVDTVQPLIEERGHELTICCEPPSILMDVDPVRLVQVIGNLLTNSAKYTAPGGHIWVTARQTSNQITLSVRDNGFGIAPDMRNRIFELFMQVDQTAVQSQTGLGIGLTLVNSLVEMHGGTVEARSEGLGKGSEFIVTLPCALRAEHRPIAEDQNHAALTTGLDLLVVDDNKDAAASLAILLRLHGHRVTVTYDGRSALEMAIANPPQVIFLDLGMPVIDGYELARRIRLRPELNGVMLVALTGWGDEEDRRRSAAAGLDHHLVKPPDLNLLESILKTVCP